MTGASISKELTTGDWDNGKIWVEKKLGNSYSYTEGYSIEIAKGNSQVINIAGAENNIEESYTGAGQRTSRTVSGKGVKQEWKYSRDTGATLSYSASKQYGNTINTFNFDWTNKAAASFSFSATASFSFSASASFAIAISLAASMKIDLNPLDLNIKVPWSGISIGITKGGDINLVLPACSVQIKGPAPDIVVKGAGPKVEMGMAEIKQKVAEIKNTTGLNFSGSILNLFL
jgi:hypothetical protein